MATDIKEMKNKLKELNDLSSEMDIKEQDLCSNLQQYCDFELVGVMDSTDGITVGDTDANICLVKSMIDIINKKGKCTYEDFLKVCF